MFVCNDNVNKISADVVEQLGQFSVSVLADAISALGSDKNRVLGSRIHGLKAGMKFFGVAVTVKAPEGNLFPIQYALYKGFEGAVLCVDTQQHEGNPYLGEMMSVTAKGFGYRAIVIDGLVRDKAEICAMNYPVFAVGTHPRPKTPVVGGEINVPIMLDGVQVLPGDFVAGDDDGLVVIAPECAEALIGIAQKKFDGDEARLQNILRFFETPEAERDVYTTMGPGFAKSYRELNEK